MVFDIPFPTIGRALHRRRIKLYQKQSRKKRSSRSKNITRYYGDKGRTYFVTKFATEKSAKKYMRTSVPEFRKEYHPRRRGKVIYETLFR